MNTVFGSLASTLGLLTFVGILLSLLVRLVGLRYFRPTKARQTAAARSVDSAKEELAAEQTKHLVQALGRDMAVDAEGQAIPSLDGTPTLDVSAPSPTHSPTADKIAAFNAEVLERYTPPSRFWSPVLTILPAFAGVAATILSVLVGVQFLYIPMVSDGYRQLYLAYCQTDGIVEVLSRRVSDRKFVAGVETDACLPPASTAEASAAAPAPSETDNVLSGVAGLSEDDVFFLIDALGLRDQREKTKTELFANTQTPTKNHDLAVWLTDPDIYTLGTPTSLLLLRLAGRISAGFSVEVSCPTNALTLQATQIGFKTAILAAVLAQQPAPGHPHAALGTALLGANGPLPLQNVVQFDQDACDGDKALAAAGLGPNFGGSPLVWRSPLLEKPFERLTEAQVISLVLGWAGWEPAADPSQAVQQDATIAFMEAITSEAGGTPEVRDAKIAVNFFIGWERLAILCVVPFLGLCLLWQQIVNIDDARHLREIKQTIRETARDQRLRVLSLAILAKRLYRGVGRSGPREILVAALEVHAQTVNNVSPVDFDRVRRVADHEMRIMDRSRFFFLAGLPLLPTIGFVGTVRSLIEALALADRIPRARTAIEQVAAVSDVTSTLSLCFSTTFMALGALLVFAPLDLWQATSERRVVEETERLLDPGL